MYLIGIGIVHKLCNKQTFLTKIEDILSFPSNHCLKLMGREINMLENGKDVCNCVKTECERRGKCKECIEFHANQEPPKLPFCKRPENIKD